MAELSSRLKEFLKRHILTVWQLELLLFFRSRHGSANLNEVSQALYLDDRAVELGIERFISAQILERDAEGRFSYKPSLANSKMIDELAEVYATRRTSVINFIYSSPIQSFSDAFKISPEKED